MTCSCLAARVCRTWVAEATVKSDGIFIDFCLKEMRASIHHPSWLLLMFVVAAVYGCVCVQIKPVFCSSTPTSIFVWKKACKHSSSILGLLLMLSLLLWLFVYTWCIMTGTCTSVLENIRTVLVLTRVPYALTFPDMGVL